MPLTGVATQQMCDYDAGKSAGTLPDLSGDALLKDLAESAHGLCGAHLEGVCQRVALNAFESLRVHGPISSGGSTRGAALPIVHEWWEALELARADVLANLSLNHVGLGSQSPARASATDAEVALVTLPAGKELLVTVLLPLREPWFLKALGVKPPRGVLLHGSPGCGKTTLARAVALATKANFIEVQAPQLVSSLVGESEKRLVATFDAARAAAPCILFMDQLEALAPSRGHHSSSEQTMDRLLSLLLIELDGMHKVNSASLVFLAATGAQNKLDKAILRPGRLDVQLMVKTPGAAQRLALLKHMLKHTPNKEAALSLERIALETDGFSLAQLSALCREATLLALREDLAFAQVTMRHLEIARASQLILQSQ